MKGDDWNEQATKNDDWIKAQTKGKPIEAQELFKLQLKLFEVHTQMVIISRRIVDVMEELKIMIENCYNEK